MSVVQVTENGFTRDGQAFTPWGANYFVPGTGWPPQLWKRFEPERAREDFRRMSELGVNVVRVFATWASFVESETEINEEGFGKFEQMLDIAWENGILLHPTGPDHWEGGPFFTSDRNYITSEPMLKAAENYWREMGRRFKDDERIFAFDILNEPSVRPDEIIWEEWRKIAEAKDDPVNWPARYEHPSQSICGEARMAMERLANRYGDRWLGRLTEAIRSTGTSVPVTCGFLQHTFPLTGGSCGFHLSGAAEILDFISIHYYPGNINGSMDYRRAADSCALWASYAASFGLPVIFGEFGWTGGNTRPMVGGGQVRLASSTEELSAVWCRDLVVNSRPFACGWLCWGTYDIPEARDCTLSTGLLDAQGRVKEWGRMFQALGPQVAGNTMACDLPVKTFDAAGLVAKRLDHADEADRLIFQRRVEGDFMLKELQPQA